MTEQDFLQELRQEITGGSIAELKQKLAIMAVKAEQFGGTEMLAHWFDEMRRLLSKDDFTDADLRRLAELKDALDKFRLEHGGEAEEEKQMLRCDIHNALQEYKRRSKESDTALKSLQALERKYRDKYGEPSGVVTDAVFYVDDEEE